MFSLVLLTPTEMAIRTAERARARRLALGLRQQDVAERAGVSLASLRRFERTGLIAFDSLLSIAVVLDAVSEFDRLFPEPEFRSIDDVIGRPARKRAPRR
jgi:transcriptional regulator with XRE-family HTH domain